MQVSTYYTFVIYIANISGWSVCPSVDFGLGLCLNDTSWTSYPQQSTVLSIRKRYASVAYDLANFSILSIESISDPEPITPTFVTDTVGNLTKIFNLAFSPIPNTFNTSDRNFETYAASWSNFYMLSWALRLYQDDYPQLPRRSSRCFKELSHNAYSIFNHRLAMGFVGHTPVGSPHYRDIRHFLT